MSYNSAVMPRQILLVALTLLALVSAVIRLRDNLRPFTIASYLKTDHPVRIAYERYRASYDDENSAFLLLIASSPLLDGSRLFLTDRDIHQKLVTIDGIEAVRSISEAEYLVIEDDDWDLAPFFNEEQPGPLVPEALRLIREDSLFQNSMLSADGTAWLTQITFTPNLPAERTVMARLYAVADEIEASHPDLQAHWMGAKIFKDHFVTEVIRSQKRISPLLFCLIGLCLFAIFRRPSTVLSCLHLIVLAYTLMLHFILTVERGLGPFSAYALFFVVIIATSDLVHYFFAWNQFAHLPLRQRIKTVHRQILVPCLLTSLTTGATFFTLAFSKVALVANFGLYCAVGCVLCFILTFVYLPFFLKIFKVGAKTPAFRPTGLPLLGNWISAHRKGGYALFLLSTLVFILLLNRLTVDDNLRHKFTSHHPVTQAAEAFENAFGFLSTVDIILKPTQASILDPELYAHLASLDQAFRQVEDVASIKSLYHFQRYVKSLGAPELEEELLETLLDEGLAAEYLNTQRNELRNVVFLRHSGFRALKPALAQLDAVFREPRFASQFKAEIAGVTAIRTTVLGQIFSGFVSSFGYSFLILWLVFALTFRSLPWATLAMIPNLYPLLAIGGLMALLEIPVDSNLVILVCATLGLAVDDTVHFLYAFNKEQDKGVSYNQALSAAYARTGGALIGTTTIFVISTSSFFLSGLAFFRQVGGLLMVAMVLALATDLLLLPLLLSRKKQAWGEQDG